MTAPSFTKDGVAATSAEAPPADVAKEGEDTAAASTEEPPTEAEASTDA